MNLKLGIVVRTSNDLDVIRKDFPIFTFQIGFNKLGS